jgi:glycogen operon protein
MIAFRKSHPTIARSRYWRDDIRWYGCGQTVDMSHESRHFAFYLDGASRADSDLYVMINAHEQDRLFEIQEFGQDGWKLVADTSRESPHDIFEPGREPCVDRPKYAVKARSVVLLMRPRPTQKGV